MKILFSSHYFPGILIGAPIMGGGNLSDDCREHFHTRMLLLFKTTVLGKFIITIEGYRILLKIPGKTRTCIFMQQKMFCEDLL